MPLYDHSQPPLSQNYPWRSIQSGWASEIARRLNTLLPPQYFAIESKKSGNQIEIDVGSFDTEPDHVTTHGPPAALPGRSWVPPVPAKTMPLAFPDSLEVRVFLREGRPQLVAAIELVTSHNKDNPAGRDAFVGKVVGLLSEGVCVVVLDATSERRAYLHEELLRLFGWTDETNPGLTTFVGTYRPVLRNEKAELDVWVSPVAVGQPLPTMPLRLTGDLMVPVDFESTYMDVCRDRRMI